MNEIGRTPATRSIIRLLPLALAILTCVRLAGADDSGCADTQDTATMRRCSNQRLARAKDDLANLLERVESTLEPARREKLAAAQEAWQRFRDRQAAFVASVAAGGTLYELVETTERASLTEDRVKQLRRELPSPPQPVDPGEEKR